jgi:formylglycine-generating enzyme required for sulfatase activity
MSTRCLARLALFLVLFPLLAARADDTKPAAPEGMVLVPAGEFTMGTEQSEGIGPNTPRSHNDARPKQRVTLAAFFIDKTEVTNAQYKKYCDATGYPAPPIWKNGSYPAGEDEFPVTHVTWHEAAAFAEWAGKRLPTEAEWEKAARGTDAREYPWGNNWDEKRLVWNRSRADKVAQHPDGASPYGALDMAGNVFEWTASWYDAYPGATLKFEEYGENMKVIRGGGYGGYESITHTHFRCVAYPGTRSEWLGFRCAQDAK